MNINALTPIVIPILVVASRFGVFPAMVTIAHFNAFLLAGGCARAVSAPAISRSGRSRLASGCSSIMPAMGFLASSTG